MAGHQAYILTRYLFNSKQVYQPLDRDVPLLRGASQK